MTPERWLVTGGAGYIGTHIADEFIRNGKSVVIYDSLYQGLESRLVYLRAKHGVEIPLIKADIRDYNEIESVIRKYKIDGIVHTAALKAVGESMEKPDEYFQVNLEATSELIEIAKRNGVKKFIFSSTAAVYGSPDTMEPCKEDGPKAPISPYGDSKYQAESKVTAFINTPGNHGTSLRFFNVVGAAAPELLDNSVENLVPIVLGKLNKGEAPVIFGTDYPTPDGTCIRDYVDVRDVARAHLAAANATTKLTPAMNIGTGRGASVREIIKLVLDAINKTDSAVIEDAPRAGDPASLCADVSLAKSAMGFESQYSLEASIRSLF
ncbi:MAG: UDP-glucose 4-epimerase GalE [Actinobacteria bacterium]|nr:UDP-glucose 4-epimerase GalE [Actinomycetota bacterium]